MRSRARSRWTPVAAALGLMLALGPLVGSAPAGTPDADPTVVVIVSARSPVATLSRSHLTDLFLGRTSRFPDGSPAVPIDQGEGSSAREAFYSTIIGRSTAEIKAHWSKIIFTGRGRPPRAASSGDEAKQLVAQSPDAIGYIDLDLVDESVRVLRVN